MKKLIAIIILGVMVISGQAQNAKKCYKNAKKLIESQQYREALTDLNQSIALDANYKDAYVLRAQLSEKLENFVGAALDYEKAATLDPKAEDYYYQAGRLNYQIENYNKALQLLNAAITLNSKNFEALLYKANTHIKLNQNRQALLVIDNALQMQQTHMGYYTRGIANDSLKYYAQSIIDYNLAIELDPGFQKAYYGAAKAYLNNNQFDSALVVSNHAVQKFPEASEAYEMRSIVFYKRGELLNAINDLSKLETISKNKSKVLFTRGFYYYQYEHFQNAKSDFSQVLALEPTNYIAIYWLGRANEELMENTASIADYKLFLLETQNNICCSKEVADAKKRLFELNRETSAPTIIFDTLLKINQNKLLAFYDSDSIVIKGKIKDESGIDSLVINGQPVELDKNNEFSYRLIVSEPSVINITIKDVYGNGCTMNYKLQKADKEVPEVFFISPKSNEKGEICISGKGSNLLLEGEVLDASLIKEIFIDGERVNFDSTQFNPKFNLTISITNKKIITLKAVDEYDNFQEKSFLLIPGCAN